MRIVEDRRGAGSTPPPGIDRDVLKQMRTALENADYTVERRVRGLSPGLTVGLDALL